MASYYDDNFGHWENMEPGNPDREDNLEFYKRVQKESVWKKCQGCGRRVKIRREYSICNSCATRLERGEDI